MPGLEKPPSALERRRMEEEQDFCRIVMDGLRLLQELKANPESAYRQAKLDAITAFVLAESIHRAPPHTMRITIPEEVEAQTSQNWITDSEKPKQFVATAIRTMLPTAVEFTETQDDIENIRGKWLIVKDRFDLLEIEPVSTATSTT